MTERSFRYVIGIWLGVSLAMLFGLGQFGAATPNTDELDYLAYAESLLDDGVLWRPPSFSALPPVAPEPTVERTPGYPAFLALHMAAGAGPGSVRVTQFLLLLLTAFLVRSLAIRLTEEKRVGLLSAILVVTYLPFLWAATDLMAEALVTALLVGWLLLWLQAREAEGRGRWLLLGILLGAIALVKPVFILLPVGLALVEVRTAHASRSKADGVLPALGALIHRRLVPVAIGVVVVVGPWAARSSAAADSFVPLGSSGGWTLWVSMEQYAGRSAYPFFREDRQYVYGRWGDANLEAERTLSSPGARAPQAVIEAGADDLLYEAASESFEEVGLMGMLKGLPVRQSFLWRAADLGDGVGPRWLHRVAQAQWLLLLALGGVGLWAARGSLLRFWPLWITGVYVGVLHSIFHAEARYTLPARAPLLIIAAIGASWLLGRVQSSAGAERGVSDA